MVWEIVNSEKEFCLFFGEFGLFGVEVLFEVVELCEEVFFYFFVVGVVDEVEVGDVFY